MQSSTGPANGGYSKNTEASKIYGLKTFIDYALPKLTLFYYNEETALSFASIGLTSVGLQILEKRILISSEGAAIYATKSDPILCQNQTYLFIRFAWGYTGRYLVG